MPHICLLSCGDVLLHSRSVSLEPLANGNFEQQICSCMRDATVAGMHATFCMCCSQHDAKVACSQCIPPCLSFFGHPCLLSAVVLMSPNLPHLPNLPNCFDLSDPSSPHLPNLCHSGHSLYTRLHPGCLARHRS